MARRSAKLAMEVVWRPISEVVPYDRNPRIMTEAAIRKVAGSIKKFGWQQAIVVDADGVIVAGHTRLEAAKLLGMTEVPVKVASDLTPDQVRAYRIADNRVAEETEWAKDLLQIEMSELAEMDMDPSELGFDEDDLKQLLDGTWSPVLDPAKARDQVTGADVEKAKAGLEDRPADAAKLDLVQMTCPHCGETYNVERRSIV